MQAVGSCGCALEEPEVATRGVALRSVLVPVTVVRSMAVAVVGVVLVVTVADRLMAAPRAMSVVVHLVGDVRLERALVPVAVVLAVRMAVVQVVGMPFVLDRDVTTRSTVRMLVALVGSVLGLGGHRWSPRSRGGDRSRT